MLAISFVMSWGHIKYIDDNNSKNLFLSLPIYVVNMGTDPVKLYKSGDSLNTAISELPVGQGYRFYYPGKSGEWLHGTWNQQPVFSKNPLRKKSISILGQYLTLKQLQIYLLLASVLSLMLVMVMWLLNRSDQRKFDRADLIVRLQNENSQLRDRAKHQEAARNKDNRNHQANIVRAQQQIKSEQSLLEQHNNEKLKLKERFLERERQLKREFEREAKKRTQVTVNEMQASLDRVQRSYLELKGQYDQLKSDGIVFDINFQGARYEDLLKGRKFEIFFAKQLLLNTDISILEWTSDKGFENGISVAANGNPDFIILHRYQGKMAVECKYRAVYFNIKSEDHISWATVKQAKRYRQFGVKNNLPVYVALGYGENPSEPEYQYFSQIESLINQSIEKDVTNNSRQHMIGRYRANEFAIQSFGELDMYVV